MILSFWWRRIYEYSLEQKYLGQAEVLFCSDVTVKPDQVTLVELVASRWGSEWQTETDEYKPPIAMFVCHTKADMIYCKRATKKLLEDLWETEDIHMRFTYIDKIREHGFRGRIWEEVEPPSEDD